MLARAACRQQRGMHTDHPVAAADLGVVQRRVGALQQLIDGVPGTTLADTQTAGEPDGPLAGLVADSPNYFSAG